MMVLKNHNYNPYIVVHSDALLLDVVNGNQRLFGVKPINGENVLSELLEHPAPFFQAILTSKKALESIGYLDERVPSYQEWDTSIRLAERCEFICLDSPTFIYYLHSGETISKNHRRDIDGYEYIINKFSLQIKRLHGMGVWYSHLKRQYNKCVDWGFDDKANYYFKQMPLKYKIKITVKHLKRKIKNFVNKLYFTHNRGNKL